MAIRSPFNHAVPLSSENQPVKPVLPVAQLSIFQSEQDLATNIQNDADVFSVEEIDKSKNDALVDQTTAIVSRTRKPSGVEDIKVARLDTYSVTKIAVDAKLASVGSAGFGSAVAQAQAYLYVSRNVVAAGEATLEADNLVTAPAEGMITTFTADNTTSASCAGTLETSYYSIVDFRWAEDSDPLFWNPSGYTSMEVKTGAQKYVLAMRIRLSKGATLLGNDWFLAYSIDGGSTWTECQGAGTDVTIVSSVDNIPVPPNNGDPFYEFDPSNFVTTAGPGRPSLAVGRLVYYDFEQSPRVTLAVSSITELETWTALTFDPSLAGESIHFRIESANLTAFGTGVRPYSNAILGPWATNVT